MLELLKLKIPIKDSEFDEIYPPDVRKLSPRHFTPFHVSEKVSEWLNEYEKPLNLVDLGCGVGKFCFTIGALTNHNITGIDFRKNYIQLCNRLNGRFRYLNVKFIEQNILDLEFSNYNAFYFFNSFLEQVDDTAMLDERYERSPKIYLLYQRHLRNQLTLMPKGTIVVTYHAYDSQIPSNYVVMQSTFDGLLKLWKRK